MSSNELSTATPVFDDIVQVERAASMTLSRRQRADLPEESISVYLMHGDGITVPRHSPEMDETDYGWLRSTPSGDPKRAATMEYNQVT